MPDLYRQHIPMIVTQESINRPSGERTCKEELLEERSCHVGGHVIGSKEIPTTGGLPIYSNDLVTGKFSILNQKLESTAQS